MENYHDLLVTVVRLFSTVVVIVLFFMFIVRPLLDYFIASREIKHHKHLREELLVDEEEINIPVDLPVGREVNTPEEELPPPKKRIKDADMETLTRLAASDPDKASDLVKQWVNSDSSRSR